MRPNGVLLLGLFVACATAADVPTKPQYVQREQPEPHPDALRAKERQQHLDQQQQQYEGQLENYEPQQQMQLHDQRIVQQEQLQQQADSAQQLRNQQQFLYTQQQLLLDKQQQNPHTQQLYGGQQHPRNYQQGNSYLPQNSQMPGNEMQQPLGILGINQPPRNAHQGMRPSLASRDYSLDFGYSSISIGDLILETVLATLVALGVVYVGIILFSVVIGQFDKVNPFSGRFENADGTIDLYQVGQQVYDAIEKFQDMKDFVR